MNDLAILHAARSPKRCRRHMWMPDRGTDAQADPVLSDAGDLVGYSIPADAKYHCARCGKASVQSSAAAAGTTASVADRGSVMLPPTSVAAAWASSTYRTT